MMVREIGFDDLSERAKNTVLGMVELTGLILAGGEYGKMVLDHMAGAYVEHRLITYGDNKLLYTTANLTKKQSERYTQVMKSVLSEEAYAEKVECEDL